MFVFNMSCVIYPFDGGRVLRALLQLILRRTFLQATKLTVIIGFATLPIYVFVEMFYFHSIVMPFMQVFMTISALGEYRKTRERMLMDENLSKLNVQFDSLFVPDDET
jgi:Zn-dependent protease